MILPEDILNLFTSPDGTIYELYQAQAQRMAELLRKNLVDVTFMMKPVDEEQFDFFPILASHLGVVMHREQEIGENPHVIRLSELRNIPLILPNRYRFPIFEAFWNKGYGDPEILCDSRSVSNDLKWVEEGIGFAVSPSLCTRLPQFQAGELIFKSLVQPEFQYTNILAWNKKTAMSHITARFLSFQREYVKNMSCMHSESPHLDLPI